MEIQRERFADLTGEQQEALLRERMYRMLDEGQFIEALEKMLESRFARVQERIHSLEKAVVQLAAREGTVIPPAAGDIPPDDAAYKLLRWREGAVAKAKGEHVTKDDTTIDQEVQDEWRTNTMPQE